MKTAMNTGKSGRGKFSERLKLAMKQAGMKRPIDLFKALVDNGYGGAYQTVLYWCDGVYKPNIDNACLIARVLGKSTDFLLM